MGKMAVGTVSCELVSTLISLFRQQLQGNLAP